MSEEYKASTDWRALCADLADGLDAETGYTTSDGKRITHVDVVRARAALAADPPDGSGETMSWIGKAVARAIDEQMSEAVKPIPLSERRPGPNEREYDGIDYCCWWAKQQDDRWLWKWGLWSGETHWLPASTKYLPARVE